eukprot:Nk52_evm66s215 gene=Nk52_evmTU66s215
MNDEGKEQATNAPPIHRGSTLSTAPLSVGSGIWSGEGQGKSPVNLVALQRDRAAQHDSGNIGGRISYRGGGYEDKEPFGEESDEELSETEREMEEGQSSRNRHGNLFGKFSNLFTFKSVTKKVAIEEHQMMESNPQANETWRKTALGGLKANNEKIASDFEHVEKLNPIVSLNIAPHSHSFMNVIQNDTRKFYHYHTIRMKVLFAFFVFVLALLVATFIVVYDGGDEYTPYPYKSDPCPNITINSTESLHMYKYQNECNEVIQFSLTAFVDPGRFFYPTISVDTVFKVESIEIKDSLWRVIYFPNLRYITGNLTVKNNSQLVSLVFPSLTRVGERIDISNNGNMSDLGLSNLYSVKSLELKDNALLETLKFRHLTDVEHIELKGGPLRNINFDQIGLVKSLVITKLSTPKASLSIQADELSSAEQIYIYSCDTIANISFASLTTAVNITVAQNIFTADSMINFNKLDSIEQSFSFSMNIGLLDACLESLRIVGNMLTMTGNFSLKTICFPLLKTVYDVIITYNPGAKYARFPQLSSVKGRFSVIGNSLMTELNIPSLKEDPDILIALNENLEKFNASSLDRGGFSLVGNSKLKFLELPSFSKSTYLMIVENHNLENLSMKALTRVATYNGTTTPSTPANAWGFIGFLPITDLYYYLRELLNTNQEYMPSVVIVENPKLANISFLKVQEVDGHVYLLENQALRTFELPILRALGIQIVKNPRLEGAVFPKLESTGKEEVDRRASCKYEPENPEVDLRATPFGMQWLNNSRLKEVSFPKLRTLNYCLKVVNNSVLATVNFANITTKPSTVIIANNPSYCVPDIPFPLTTPAQGVCHFNDNMKCGTNPKC